MKKVILNAYQVGLVFKDGVYQRVITEGKYWFWSGKVMIYDITQPFYAPIELNILLQDAVLANMLYVVDVKDNEIVLQFENGLLKQVLTAGRYTFWKSVINYDFIRADISKIEIEKDIDRAVLQNRLLQAYVRSYSVESYEK